MKRIEIEQLEEGDVFEYEHDRLKRLVRDQVKKGPSWRPKEEREVLRQGTDFFKARGKLMTCVYTTGGENNHGYVILPARTVVILIRKASA